MSHLIISVLFGGTILLLLVLTGAGVAIFWEWQSKNDRGKIIAWIVILLTLSGLLGHYVIRGIWP